MKKQKPAAAPLTKGYGQAEILENKSILKTGKLAVHNQKPRGRINRNQNVDEQKPGFGRSGSRYLCYHQSGIRRSNSNECEYSGNRNVVFKSKEAEEGRARDVD